MGILRLDFETYSECDIKQCGLGRYAVHPSTDVVCLAWAIDDEPVQLWTPADPPPTELFEAIARRDTVHAFNSSFERAIWQHVMVTKHGWPRVNPLDWRCTAARCAHANLPRSLANASAALELGDKGKDKEGHRMMLKLCRPQRGKRLDRVVVDPTKKTKALATAQAKRDAEYATLFEYCKRDVEAERLIHGMTPRMTLKEHTIWQLDRKINDRGVPVDMGLCQGAVEVLQEAGRRADLSIAAMTNGKVQTVGQRDEILKFLVEQGTELPNLRRQTIEEWRPDDNTAPLVTDLLTLRRESALASVKKMYAVVNWADEDCRVRGSLNYYAAGTGRWGGRGPQFQNMVRAKTPSEEILAAIASGSYDAVAQFGSVIPTISSATRAIICAPPGRKLVISDFASIEARVLHWLVDDTETLQKFEAGVDLYKDMASKIYGVPVDEVTKDQRQIGKIAVLALGYGQGAGGFVGSCKNMGGVEISQEFAEDVVAVYRSQNAQVVTFWREVNKAAIWSLKKRRQVRCGRVKLRPEGDWLLLELPSGRCLYYHKPKIGTGKFDNETVYYHGVRKNSYGRIDLYGGLLTENLCQAIARDVLAEALLGLDKAGVFVSMHVHDSVLAECLELDDETPKRLHSIMEQVPDWCEGLPLKAETYTAKRMG